VLDDVVIDRDNLRVFGEHSDLLPLSPPDRALAAAVAVTITVNLSAAEVTIVRSGISRGAGTGSAAILDKVTVISTVLFTVSVPLLERRRHA
jgi:hypothetical protein